jgi:hypothetical protein
MGTGEVHPPYSIFSRGLDSAFKMDLNLVTDPEMLYKEVATSKAFDTGEFLTVRTWKPGT